MEFHRNGFRPGDPRVSDAVAASTTQAAALPEHLDVLIVGSGPAGLTLAAQLCAFPEINTRLVERKAGPLTLGQADGVSCRSMEMFNAFGFAEEVIREGYQVNETTFWQPENDTPEHIRRVGRVQDVEDGLSEMPHIILNQARVHDMYLTVMRNSPSRMGVDYGYTLVDLALDIAADDYPITVSLVRDDGTNLTVRCRYVVGCDGARSTVRSSIGRELTGDYANQAWGVMDVLAITDFPDIRFKSVIQSSSEGNVLLIPREGDHLVRIYVELDALQDRGERADTTLDQLIDATQKILKPYAFDVKEVAWWSVYEVGHSLTDKFDDVPQGHEAARLPRIFIAGDACHTHSAKAGQGMNVSMGDTFNLGWKLISVLTRRADSELLHTYSAERQAIAQDLIDFDHRWSRVMSEPPAQADGQPLVQKHFIAGGQFTAGLAVRYPPSSLIGTDDWQALAPGFEIGKRFHSAPVTRLSDGKTVHLGHSIKADSRWHLFVFTPQEPLVSPDSALARLGDFLSADPRSPVLRHTPKGGDSDSIISTCAVFQPHYRDLDINEVPDFLKPRVGRYGLTSYNKLYCAVQSPAHNVFDMRGIDRHQGCLIIVRPDQYVAHVLPLTAYEALEDFFRNAGCKSRR